MAIQIVGRKPEEPSVLRELAKWLEDPLRTSPVLTIMRKTTGDVYKVVDFNPETQMVTLQTQDTHRKLLRPTWSPREEKLYLPVWR